MAGCCVLAFLLGAPPAQGASRPACTLRTPTRTLVATEYARVFEKTRGRERNEIYGCLYGTKRSFHLGSEAGVDEHISTGFIRLAGNFVAFQFGPFRDLARRPTVRVVDLRTGQVVSDEPAGPSASPDENSQVANIVLSEDGSVAWFAYYLARRSERVEVRKSDGGGKGVLLDSDPLPAGSSPGVAQGSLALSGGVVYWTKANQPQAHRLTTRASSPPPRKTTPNDGRCGKRKSRTIAASREARIYTVPTDEDERTVFGCLLKNNRRHELGVDGDFTDTLTFQQVRLVETHGAPQSHVAFDQDYAGRAGFGTEIMVVDLVSGYVRFRWQAGAAYGIHPDATTTDIELTNNGAIGWITGFSERGSTRYTVHVADAHGHRELDDGHTPTPTLPTGGAAGVAPDSLALTGARILYWLRDGEPRSALLHEPAWLRAPQSQRRRRSGVLSTGVWRSQR